MKNFMVDGGDSNGTLENQAAVRIIPDAVEEFRVLTNTFNPEFGRNSGSVVNIITKSGTNQWHGDLFEFLRNDALNARNFFETTKAPYELNQFGGTVGGPIKKDKTFLFLSYEGSRERGGAPGTPTRVFSDQERNGAFGDRESDFPGSTSAPFCFPAGSSNCFPAGTAYSSIFPGAQIPLTSLDPVAGKTLYKYIPPSDLAGSIPSIFALPPDHLHAIHCQIVSPINFPLHLSCSLF